MRVQATEAAGLIPAAPVLLEDKVRFRHGKIAAIDAHTVFHQLAFAPADRVGLYRVLRGNRLLIDPDGLQTRALTPEDSSA